MDASPGLEMPARPAGAGVAPGPSAADPPDLRRGLAVTLVPQAATWALVMMCSTASMRMLPGGERAERSSLGFLAGLGEPGTACSCAGVGIVLGAVAAVLPLAPIWRARTIQVLGLAYTFGLVAWSQAALACVPFLGSTLDHLPAWSPIAWAAVPVGLVALLVLLLRILEDETATPFPTVECAHSFLLVAAVELPFLTLAMDAKLPLDLAVVWSGHLAACFAGLGSGLVLEAGWRRRAAPHLRYGPWFSLAVSSVAALVVVRRVAYILTLLE